MNKQYTPNNITSLQPNEVFVFGSNEAGRHGAGAAKTAVLKFGATYGVASGIQGRSYAIPTKDRHIQTLPISEIKRYVDRFYEFAKSSQNLIFYVTEIGCGLAGYTPAYIAPLFIQFKDLDNVLLPRSFWGIYDNKSK